MLLVASDAVVSLSRGSGSVQAALVHCTKDGNTKRIPIANERTLLGRLDDCQIRIPSGKISRHHCELVFDDGGFTIKDLGSSNGTYVNRVRVEEARRVGAGDLISIGSLVFVLVIDGEPGTIDGGSFYAQGLPEKKSPSVEGPGGPAEKAVVSKHAPTTSGEDSSMMDFNFEFDLDDEDDDQPPL